MEWIRKNSERKINVNKKDEVVYLTFPVMEETGIVKHGFSTRMGGVSTGIFSSMNLSFNRGDELWAVRENYERMAKALDTKTENMVLSKQTHSDVVRVVTAKDKGKGIHFPMDYEEVDAMVTNEPGIMLVTTYADCVPIYLVDPVNKVIGLIHSGWRGTVQKISAKVIRIMEEKYQSRPQDLVAAIGPSICQACYEVSEDVADEFKKIMPEHLWKTMMEDKGNGKYQLDLWEANAYILEEAGVLKSRIQIPDICTCCNSQYLFSHRASKGKRGNLCAFLELKK